MSRKLFLLGLIAFYSVIFLSPHKIIYFSAFIISAFLFYFSTKQIRKSLLYSLVLSLFLEMGIASSWFHMEPDELNLYSGWWITPLTILSLALLPLSLKIKVKWQKADVLALLLFGWVVLVFFIFPTTNVFYGVLTLGETFLVYGLFRIHLEKSDFKNLFYILVSAFLFQSFVGALQFLFQRPLGILAESANFFYPFGLTASEETNLFRITGTFSHANMLAIFLLMGLPVIILNKMKYSRFIILVHIIMLILTQSRAAWLIAFLTIGSFLLLSMKRKISMKFSEKFIISVITILICSIFFLPYVFTRMDTVFVVFDEGGSMNTRVKLIQEGVRLISQSPIFGVGINRFQELARIDSITDVFETNGLYAGTKMHNLLFEIATEIGLPGILLFILFLLLTFYCSKSKTKNFQKSASYSLITLLLISMFHPLFQTSLFRCFFFFAAIKLAK